MGMAFAMRSYGIADQSVWRDEYLIATYLPIPDYLTFLRAWLFFSADNVPLYPSLAYLYHHLVADSDTALRLFSVSLSVSAIPLLHIFVYRAFGIKSAILASLFLALSPHHLWQAQAIRPYALLEPVILLSWLGFIEALKNKHRFWWFLHLAANFLLLAIHPFMVFLFATQAALLTLTRYRDWRLIGMWCGAHCFSGFLLLAWLASTRTYILESSIDHYFLPSAGKFLFDWLGDDAVLRTNEFAFPITHGPATWFGAPESYLSLHPLFDVGIVFMSLLAVSGTAYLGLSQWKMQRDAAFARVVFWLLSVYLLPTLMLLVVSLLWRPIIEARYTTYCSFALYAMLGLLIARVSRTGFRRALTCACVIVLSYQSLLLLSGTTRPDWLSAARHIQANLSDGEQVFADFGGQWNDELLAHALDIPLEQVRVGYSSRGLCRKIDDYFAGGDFDRKAWVAVADMGSLETKPGSLSMYFPEDSYKVESTVFPGSGPITVYAIQPREAGEESRKPAASPSPLAPLLTNVNLESSVIEDRISNYFMQPLPPSKLHYFVLSMFLFEDQEYPLGRAAAEASYNLDPTFPPAMLARALAFAFEAKPAEAWEEYRRGCERDAIWLPIFDSFLRAVLVDRDETTAKTALQALETCGFPYRTMRALYMTTFNVDAT